MNQTKCSYHCYRKQLPEQTQSREITKPLSLIFFDMDGVLTNTISSWKHIHDHFGTTNNQTVNEYLKGNIDDMEFIRRDVSLWKTNGEFTTKQHLKAVLETIPLYPGAPQLISFLKEKNVTTCIVSAGLDILADMVAEKLGIDYVYANGVQTDSTGRLTGEGILRVQLIYKNRNVLNLSKKLGIPLEQCIAVGNSCFDVSMFEVAGLGIAFNPSDSCVKEAADIIIESNNLINLKQTLEQYLT